MKVKYNMNHFKLKSTRTLRFIIATSFSAILLMGCVSKRQTGVTLEDSFLKEQRLNEFVTNEKIRKQENKLTKGQQAQEDKFRFIPPLKLNTKQAIVAEDVLNLFSANNSLTITADSLPLKDYLHQVMSELLKVSYVLSDEVKDDNQAVTLNLQEKISQRKLFTLTEDILSKRDYVIRYDDGIFYIHKGGESKGDIVYGYGRNITDVPQSSADIVQMVPFEYGMQMSLGNTLRQLLGVKAIPDSNRNSITIQGKRKDVVRALELIQLLDRPTLKDREIGIFKTTYIEANDLVKKLAELLAQEGISVSTGSSAKKALSIVTLEKQGTLLFFANNRQVITRAVFWAKQIDQPILTADKKYFIYQPQYSRAVDMGESLEALIDGSSSGVSNSTSAANENTKGGKNRRSVRSASSKSMKMVVDERTNALIFFTTGHEYKQLLPLIKRLDVLPKQIVLEVMIAEVTLTDEFKQGVEFAFKNGKYGLSTKGAFMGEGFGGLSYLLQGANGEVALNLLQTNSLVNVLSKPSLVVRDGVNASINVGTDIPIVGETKSDPINGDNQTTSIEYRKTGVELSVTPTVNAQGVILMEIRQKISNQVEAGSTAAISPSVFERSISTEVIAESGQTIVLGGLISNNRSQKESKVPWLGDLPLVGTLFRAQTESGDKTELVIFVTPKVIESSSEWHDISDKFKQGLTQLKFN